MAEGLFVQLYPLVFLIGLAGYVPQLVHLMRHDDPAYNISLLTWYIWSLSYVIGLGYGITHLHDFMFCMVAGMNLTAHFGIIMIVSYRRIQWSVRQRTTTADITAIQLNPSMIAAE